jgi:hypothetical protein
MENIVIAIAGSILVVIQAHRNWLMVQARKNELTEVHVHVTAPEVDHDAIARAMEASWPTVNVTNDVTLDYDALAEALAKALPIPQTVVFEPAQVPMPWQNPVLSENTNVLEDGHTTTNDIEINGHKAKRFPAR